MHTTKLVMKGAGDPKMKITQSTLRRIIKEELNAVMGENQDWRTDPRRHMERAQAIHNITNRGRKGSAIYDFYSTAKYAGDDEGERAFGIGVLKALSELGDGNFTGWLGDRTVDSAISELEGLRAMNEADGERRTQ